MIFTYQRKTADLALHIQLNHMENDTHMICSDEKDAFWWTPDSFVVRMGISTMRYFRKDIKRISIRDVAGTEYAEYAEVKS